MPNPQYQDRPIVRPCLKEGDTLHLAGVPIKVLSIDRGRVTLALPLPPGWWYDTKRLAISER